MSGDFVYDASSRSIADAFKKKTFSTSTPFYNGIEQKELLSVSQDSGLGSSILEPSVSFADLSKECNTISVCRTPTKCDPGSVSIHLPDFNPSASPVSSKRFPFVINSNFTSRKSFLTRRSLDSDFSCSGDESADTGLQTLSFSRISKTLDRSLVRKLDLDQDIYGSNGQVSTETVSVPSPPHEHEAILSATFDKVMLDITPVVSDRLIGRKMGREHVDIVSELDNRNISCLSFILSFMDPRDLCRMCQVSQRWKTICEQNIPANRKRKRFLHRCRKVGKENFSIHKRSTADTTRPDTASSHLHTIQVIPDRQIQSHTTSKTEHFVQAAAILKNDEKLQKCPRCRMAAKVLPVQERGVCLNGECQFDFCVKCLCDFHGSKTCELIAKKKTKTDSIGTKKSKKNLKRL